MSNSEINPKLSPVRFVAMSANDTVKYLSLPAAPRITETLEQFASRHPEVLTDTSLEAVVVIEGYHSAQLYSAATFRWLCGVGPDPHRKDPNWLGA